MNNILFNLFLYFKFYFCTSDVTSGCIPSRVVSESGKTEEVKMVNDSIVCICLKNILEICWSKVVQTMILYMSVLIC